jgi:DNA-binding response OmpR family regulator
MTINRRILIAEDDRKTAELVTLYLEKDGYRVLRAENGQQALEIARHRQPALVILDLMLPVIDGLDVCRVLRAESKIPIIMLTARTTEEDKLVGLALGADDYVSKPFSPRELVARVRAVLRRSGENQEEPLKTVQVGALFIDFVGHEVFREGEPLRLTPTEFQLLEIFVREAGRALPRLDLLERLFGMEYEGLERTIDVHVMNLRKKIEPDPTHPTYIQTVFGVGYKLVEVPNVG